MKARTGGFICPASASAFPAGGGGALFLMVVWAIGFEARSETLEWEPGAGYRSAAVEVTGGAGGFKLIPGVQTGITFTNLLPKSRYTTNQMYLNGSGVAAGDVDRDGLCDLFFGGLGGRSALYRNLGGWKFKDVTRESGAGCPDLDVTGVAFADLDGDGDLDLVVNSIGGGVRFLVNDGRGRFTATAGSAGLNLNRGGMSVALADVDGDGDLDLYAANYRMTTLRDLPYTRFRGKNRDGVMVLETVNGRPVTEPDLAGRFTISPSGGILEHGEADAFFLNQGAMRFTPIPFTGGTFLDEEGRRLDSALYDWGLSVMFRDINGDRAPDIYICNDFTSPDRIWINTGKGTFRALDRAAIRHTSLFSMGVDFADLDRDGRDELFTADMLSLDRRRRQVQIGDLLAPDTFAKDGIPDRPQYSYNMLFYNRGDGTYAEIAHFCGLEASEWTWTAIFLDVDLDGFEDLLVTTGNERDTMNGDAMERIEREKAGKRLPPMQVLNLNNLFPRLDTANAAFRNRGDLTFELASRAWGFDAKGVAHGMALADLDNDGDLDVAVNNLNQEAGIYRNEAGGVRVGVRLRGLPPNTEGIGAKIKLLGGAVPAQAQEMICGGRYLSDDDSMRVFAAGTRKDGMTIEVEWRSGKRSVVTGVRANRIYEIDERGATAPASGVDGGSGGVLPLFEDASRSLGHTHVDEVFDDFARQPLLPNRLSQGGPGVSWCDVDGDGREDLLIGSGKNGTPAFYRNKGEGRFERERGGIWGLPVPRDQTTLLGWGERLVLAGLANYEAGPDAGASVVLYDTMSAAPREVVPGGAFSTGPLALGDVDGDGDLDLFVGGRVIPGRYGEPADSLLFEAKEGRMELLQKFERLGLVSGAVFSDLDADGMPELILACEWGPVRVFRREGRGYAEITFRVGLAEYRGWWNGVTTGDLDGDGRLDIVASNWGLNSKYRASREYPRKLYYGDIDGNGTVDLIEAYFDRGMGKEVTERGMKAMLAAIPMLRERSPSFESYAAAGTAELFGEKLGTMGVLQAHTLESMLFLNRGDRFEAVPLPREAQWAPAFGVVVADLDGDGNEDLFLSQNFFGVNRDNFRCDAGRGLFFQGDGTGRLRAMPGAESGIQIYGEQRGGAVCDYDEDGRLDLAVAQNRGETKLYRNVRGRPGLRVRLHAGPENPTGVGAVIRLRFGPRVGPAREVRSGSGYWSQDSAVLVFGTPEPPDQIEVRWPGGKTTVGSVPIGAREIQVVAEGGVIRLR